MKRRILVLAVCAVLVCLAATGCAAGGEGFALAENTSVIWLDRYEEADIPLAKGDPAALT